MNRLRDKEIRREIRHLRARRKISGTTEKPRLVVSRSLKYLYIQVIDDINNKTFLTYSTVHKDIKDKLKGHKNIEAAKTLGLSVAGKLKEKGINKIVFDRNGYLYHGKIKALADALREGGLEF